MEKEGFGRVYIRCRPLLNKEISLCQTSCVNVNIKEGSVVVEKDSKEKKTFIFNTVFNEYDTQQSLYKETTMALVENLFFGLSGTVIAYGQTGSGKTYSMIGSSDEINKGIIPRSLVEAFELLSYPENKASKVFCSFVNLRDENVVDLQAESLRKVSISKRKTKDQRITFEDLILEECQTLEQAREVLAKGKLRIGTLASTEIKKYFEIFTLYVLDSSKECETTLDIQEKAAQLQFIIFAASETKETKTGLEKSPIGYLNQLVSDLILDNKSAIFYNNTKLIPILQDALEGYSRLVMIATITPQKQCIDETIKTLEFAQQMNKLFCPSKQPTDTSITSSVKEQPKEAIKGKFKKLNAALRQKLGKTVKFDDDSINKLIQEKISKKEELENKSTNPLESAQQSIENDDIGNLNAVSITNPTESSGTESTTKNDVSENPIPSNDLFSEGRPQEVLFFKALCDCFLTSKEIKTIRNDSLWIEDEHRFQLPEKFPANLNQTEEHRARIQSAFNQLAVNFQNNKKEGQPIQ